MARLTPSPSGRNTQNPGRLGRATGAEKKFAQDGNVAGRGHPPPFSKTKAPPRLRRKWVPSRFAVERPDGFPAITIQTDEKRKHGFRLDRRVVADDNGAVGFAGRDGAGRLDQRHDCRRRKWLVTAGVGALEIITDAHVAQHVVRQVPQEPQRIDQIAEQCAIFFQVAFRGSQGREENRGVQAVRDGAGAGRRCRCGR